jgi:hypothetical protein
MSVYQIYILGYLLLHLMVVVTEAAVNEDPTGLTPHTESFFLGQSLYTKCCYVTPIGVECPNQLNRTTLYNIVTDNYAGLELYQTFLLVASNVPLFFVALQTYYLRDYTRTFIIIGAALISSLFHLCKTKTGMGICVLPFCTLRALDYAFSNTVLVSAILFVLPIVLKSHDTLIIRGASATYWPNNGGAQRLNGANRIDNNIEQSNFIQNYIRSLKRFKFIESYILIAAFTMVFFSVSGPLLCNGTNVLNFLVVLIIWTIFIGLIGGMILYYWNNIRVVIDTKYTFIGLLFGIGAIIPFIVEGFIDVSSYWITHSLWHLLAAPALLFIFNCRHLPHDSDPNSTYYCCWWCTPPKLQQYM